MKSYKQKNDWSKIMNIENHFYQQKIRRVWSINMSYSQSY